jgi:hypothetical protein
MKQMKSSDSVKQTIATLTDMHRPLEEHWIGAKTRFPLDANNSDMIYKHHMAKLEEIYLNHNSYKSEPSMEIKSMTPVSQLYGINGLYTSNNPVREERKRDKEFGWVNNMHREFAGEAEGKAGSRPISRGSDFCRAPSCLGITPATKNLDRTKIGRTFGQQSISSSGTTGRFEPLYKSANFENTKPFLMSGSGASSNQQSTSRPNSAGGIRHSHNHHQQNPVSGSALGGVARLNMKQDQYIRNEYYPQMHQPAVLSVVNNSNPNSRSRCTDNEAHLKGEDLIMLGMYRLNEKQAAIYSDFVEMISGMDTHDACKVVEDALKDSLKQESGNSGGSTDLMSMYGGTELPTGYYGNSREPDEEEYPDEKDTMGSEQ